MALVTTCAFCPHSSLDHDHDECAQKYGDDLKREMFDWHVSHPGEPLPPQIALRLKGRLWRAYQEYLERLKGYAKVEWKKREYADRLLQDVQQYANAELRKIDPEGDFEVQVKVTCSETPRC